MESCVGVMYGYGYGYEFIGGWKDTTLRNGSTMWSCMKKRIIVLL